MALTIRFNNHEQIALNEIKEKYEIKTSSGAIKFILLNYLMIVTELNQTELKRIDEKQQNRTIREQIALNIELKRQLELSETGLKTFL